MRRHPHLWKALGYSAFGLLAGFFHEPLGISLAVAVAIAPVLVSLQIWRARYVRRDRRT
jgi:hypothetical protein